MQTQPLQIVGVQTPAFSIYEEGIEHYLDVLQHTIRANAVFILPDSTPNFLECDKSPRTPHGKEIEPYPHAIEPPHDPKFYRECMIQPPEDVPGVRTDHRDVFEDLREPVQERGMKLYARLIQSGNPGPRLPNAQKAAQIDCFGRTQAVSCLNNPHFLGYEYARIEELVRRHPYLDGLNYLQERSGLLSAATQMRDPLKAAPACFCRHCRERAARQGIDADRAAEGWRLLYDLLLDAKNGEDAPDDGILIVFLRLLISYPEILAWEKLWWDSLHDFRAGLYGMVKSMAPQWDMGWHIHQCFVHNMPARAMMDYSRIARYSDHVKPTIYPGCAGTRSRNHWQNHLFQALLRDVPKPTSLDMMLSFLQFDPANANAWEDYEAGNVGGLGPAHAYDETLRAVRGVQGRAPIYAGVGFDIPGYQDSPEEVYEYCMASAKAGAHGFLISREYHELKMENLEAVGRAVEKIGGPLMSSGS